MKLPDAPTGSACPPPASATTGSSVWRTDTLSVPGPTSASTGEPSETSVCVSYGPSSARCAPIIAPCENPNTWTASPGCAPAAASAASVAA